MIFYYPAKHSQLNDLKCLLFSFLNQIPFMKNFLSAFKFMLPVLLLAAAIFLFAAGGHDRLWQTTDPGQAGVVVKSKTGTLPPPCA